MDSHEIWHASTEKWNRLGDERGVLQKTISRAIGSPRRAAKGQLKKVDAAVAKIAVLYDPRYQAPWLTIKSNIDVDEGRNAVEEIYIPVERTENINAI